MARFKLTLEYAGTRYSGWQIQQNARTVQGELARVVRDVTGQKQFELYGSGRTDAGVHALAQVALPCAARCRRAQLSVPNLEAPHGVREALRVVGARGAGRHSHARHRGAA